MSTRRYGYIKDARDERDFPFMAPRGVQLPTRVSLKTTPKYPGAYDQLSEGSCVGQGCAFVFQFLHIKEGLENWVPARNMIYYNARVLEGTVNEDVGCQIRDGVKSLNRWGVCPESLWKYDVSKFAVEPSKQAYAEAMKHRAIQYHRVPRTLYAMKSVLASGLPFVFGTQLYESFESDEVARTGVVMMPRDGEQEIGGHCMACVGYDEKTKRWDVRNSWGTGWGQKGHCTMPFDYLISSLTTDIWVLTFVK